MEGVRRIGGNYVGQVMRLEDFWQMKSRDNDKVAMSREKDAGIKHIVNIDKYLTLCFLMTQLQSP
jgi:hypothetical protein